MTKEQEIKFQFDELKRLKSLGAPDLLDELVKNVLRESLVKSLLEDYKVKMQLGSL